MCGFGPPIICIVLFTVSSSWRRSDGRLLFQWISLPLTRRRRHTISLSEVSFGIACSSGCSRSSCSFFLHNFFPHCKSFDLTTNGLTSGLPYLFYPTAVTRQSWLHKVTLHQSTQVTLCAPIVDPIDRHATQSRWVLFDSVETLTTHYFFIKLNNPAYPQLAHCFLLGDIYTSAFNVKVATASGDK